MSSISVSDSIVSPLVSVEWYYRLKKIISVRFRLWHEIKFHRMACRSEKVHPTVDWMHDADDGDDDAAASGGGRDDKIFMHTNIHIQCVSHISTDSFSRLYIKVS